MTVEELINKLSKLNPKMVVTVENNNIFEDGLYVATDITDMDDGIVSIDTDYEERIDW